MPQKNCHSFVSLVQLEMAYDRSKVERDMFSIAAMQPNFVRGRVDHYHNGFPVTLEDIIFTGHMLQILAPENKIQILR